jgi:glycosyltransferase involved in cell wall biosynthesis
MSSVSYIVTVFNKERFLPFLLSGLARQQGAFDRQYIFVDDGSTDDSRAILRRLTADWADVVMVEQANQGPASAMNRGLDLARGEFIKPVDADDILTPWATARLMQAIAETGCPVAYGAMDRQGRYALDADPDRLLADLAPLGGPALRHDDMLRMSLHGAQTNPSSWLARADIVRQAGGCDPRVFIQDYSIEIRLAAQASFAGVSECIFLAPDLTDGRLSQNKAQILHDVNLAVADLLAEHPALPAALRRYAFERAAGRSWAWARRHGGKTPASVEFWRYLGARTGLLGATPDRVRATSRIFAETAAIRHPPPNTRPGPA